MSIGIACSGSLTICDPSGKTVRGSIALSPTSCFLFARTESLLPKDRSPIKLKLLFLPMLLSTIIKSTLPGIYNQKSAWNHFSVDNLDLKRAQKILDRDHFGLEEVKKRIIEYLAVLKLRNDMKSPILCLQGPPGVGKTSTLMDACYDVLNLKKEAI